MLGDLLILAQDGFVYRVGATAATAVAVFCGFISLRLPMGRIVRKQEEAFHQAPQASGLVGSSTRWT